jgi:hypothetical protein
MATDTLAEQVAEALHEARKGDLSCADRDYGHCGVRAAHLYAAKDLLARPPIAQLVAVAEAADAWFSYTIARAVGLLMSDDEKALMRRLAAAIDALALAALPDA